MSILENRYTVNDAADRFGRSTARIRQICIQHEIGETIGNRLRILTEAELERIGKIISENGRERN